MGSHSSRALAIDAPKVGDPMTELRWFHPPLNGGEEQGLNEAGIQDFKRPKALARETCQNIGDARPERASSARADRERGRGPRARRCAIRRQAEAAGNTPPSSPRPHGRRHRRASAPPARSRPHTPQRAEGSTAARRADRGRMTWPVLRRVSK